jgi:hypothetical protein
MCCKVELGIPQKEEAQILLHILPQTQSDPEHIGAQSPLVRTIIKQNKIQKMQGPKRQRKEQSSQRNIQKESTSTYFLNGYIQGG